MATIATLQHESAALGRRATCTVLLPDHGGAGPWPVLYLLHGQSDDHRAWLENTTLAPTLARLATELAVVLPDGAISYWADVHPLLRYESYLLDDLDALVHRLFPLSPGPVAIGGLSMGGYGALRLALRHPHRFSSVTAHSTRAPTREELAQLPWAQHVPIETLDLASIAAHAAGSRLPPIALDCGRDDRLLPDSRRVHETLESLGVAHAYGEHEGAHDWAYWNRRLPDALAFHAATLVRSRA
jgi:S-formylglutathione hydrolase FrmB